MNALLWKDLRMSRSVIGFSFFLGFLPYLASILIMAGSSFRQEGIGWALTGSYDGMMQAGTVSLVLSLLSLTILGGEILAREREDGSHEFLATLPPSPLMALGSKALVVLGASILLLGGNAIAIMELAPHLPGAPLAPASGGPGGSSERLLYAVEIFLLMLGTTWWLASFSGRASTAWLLGILSPVALAAPLILAETSGLLSSAQIDRIFLAGAVILGILGVAKGSLNYLRGTGPG